MKHREFKKKVLEILSSDKDIGELLAFPKKRTASLLISFLSYPDENIKKRAMEK